MRIIMTAGTSSQEANKKNVAVWIFFVVFAVVENRRYKKQAQEKANAAS
jgi:hypothetical protein